MGYKLRIMKVPELLAPAGNMEILETACLYGADAVYLGLKGPGNLRAGARNFGIEELEEAVERAHARGVKVYLALNSYAHDSEFGEFPPLIRRANAAGVDALIVADLGVLTLVREQAPAVPVHLSTQANTVNSRAVNAWQALGVERVILARELSDAEIRHIRSRTGCELEIFVHGSLCISISGRCLISAYLSGRDANQGRCTQPCRWDYALVERTRPGEYLPVGEDGGYSYILNSRDLCLLPYLGEVLSLGVDGLKIEGRGKAALYVATVTNVYRQAIDAWRLEGDGFQVRPAWLEELGKVSHRGYFPGFFAGTPGTEGLRPEDGGYERSHQLAAKVIGEQDGETLLEARNPLVEGMQLEKVGHDGSRQTFILEGAHSGGARVRRIRPQQIFTVAGVPACVTGELIRKPFSEGDRVLD